MIRPVAFLRLVLAAALAVPLFAQAAGLGRLTVQSFLGQPLRAEIEVVSLLPGEESSLEARLATGNAFAQAGIEFNPALAGVRFAIEKRDARTVLRVTTRQSVNEPFLDMLVELRWATGLLVREYTVLLDPPDYNAPKPMAVAPVPAVPASVAPMATAPATPAAAPSAEAPPAATPAAAPTAETPAAAPAAETAPAAPVAEAAKPAERIEERPIAAVPPPAEVKAETYEVKKGDTLGAIARQYRPEGVSFNQMLIALQRANEDAFIRNNVNLVRAGRILNIPDRDTIAAVEPADANRLISAQMADFADYRSRLAATVAASPTQAAPAERAAAGTITPKPAEPKPAEPKDQLKLSKADPKKPAAPAAKAAREDDLVARERALQEAQSRVTDLEKNVADLQKLMELKNQQLAELERKAAKPAAVAPAPVAKAPEPPKPAPAPQAAKAPEAKPAAQVPVSPAAEPAQPTAPPPAVEAAKPAAKPAPVKPRPAAAPPPEPSLVDEFLDNPVALAGLGGVVLLLAGYGAWAWQRKKKSVNKFQDSVLGAASSAPVAAAAAVAAAAPASVSQTSVSQGAVGGMDTDDVDPIAEADVYMAYGRDAQAEEILKEALQKDARRIPVHAKLLEIYANRRDAKSFEQIALKLKGLTGGAGADWDKAAALGRSFDAGNGLYGGSGGDIAAAPAPAPAAAPAPNVDFDIGGGQGGGESAALAPTLDLDLGGASVPSQEKSDFSPGGTLIIDADETKAASGGLDFDLGGAGDKRSDTTVGLNFELPASAPAAAQAPVPAPSAAPSSGGLDFDLNLGGTASNVDSTSPSVSVDLSEISLDLGMPGEAPAAGASADPKWQEVATKLDLAKAYEEMGDKDGARELLNEVAREGDAAQQGQANQMLARLG